MAKRGPKTKYDPKITPQLWKQLARAGQTDAQIAKTLGVSRDTLHEWRKQHPEISDTIKEGKEFVDSLVEDSLLKRALGYGYEETEVVASKRLNKDGQEETKPVSVKKVKKQVAPDVTAQIFWLKNRQPEKWRDKQDVDHSGGVSLTVNYVDTGSDGPRDTD